MYRYDINWKIYYIYQDIDLKCTGMTLIGKYTTYFKTYTYNAQVLQ